MPRIYVSSTYKDLVEHRTAVHQSLRRLGHDVIAMESYVASDQRPLDRCLDDVASSDIYVGILAWRYGHVPQTGNPDRLSITELEYQHAMALGIPCLMFVLDADTPWPPGLVDKDSEGPLQHFRKAVSAEHLVSFFRTADELSALVVAAVTSTISGSSEEPARVKLVVLHDQGDQRLVDQLVTKHLGRLRREELVEYIEVLPIDNASSPRALVRSADAVVLMLSPGVLNSGYFESRESAWLLSRIGAGHPQLVPVLLRTTSYDALPATFARITPLPALGRPINEETDRDAAMVDVADGLRLVCRNILTRRRRTPRSQRSTRQICRLVDVFKESGVPSVTFVEPDNFYELMLALEQPGRGVVIEGPSGVGKTTALQSAIRHLNPGTRTEFPVLRARDVDDLASIRTLRKWHRSPVAIDDFHRLDHALRAELADYLKLLADIEPPDRKLVIVGIPGTHQHLVDMAFDVATRITVLPLGFTKTEKVVEMIEKGESALNVDIVSKADIARAAAGSLNIAQILCRHAIAQAGINETQATTTLVDTDIFHISARTAAMIGPKYEALISAFASLDGPNSRFCIELLSELAIAEQSMLRLMPLRQRRPDLAAGIDQFVSGHFPRLLAQRDPTNGQHLIYDESSSTLVVDDPQLTFYLRQLNPVRLSEQVGKRPQTVRTRIFISYSHVDREWSDRVRTHLAPLERAGIVDLWADTRIRPGTIWRNEISAALQTARVAVLLISADFLASEFIRNHELPPLLSAAAVDGCEIVPLLVRPSLFMETPELSRYQPANPGEKSLSEMEKPEWEGVLVTLAKEIAAMTRGRADWVTEPLQQHVLRPTN